ncbi:MULTISPECIES: glycosyltransferase [Calothrix]|uniref:Glycosyltransferase n=2 Tax=Calothrix TaxID=1186 RepID=A0ABR8A1U3_9CYAN|nr:MULTISPECIES: glycosyltransferase [Calothrix]MBD2193877.1 glycosyltransferase [Calothrix parietina FACHB-288]MBD2222883.1 glycosyltransferase [Calothrix anomala FACHB-343]
MKKKNISIKVCVCTSYRADREPRAPRHAAAIAQLGSEFEVTFIECASMGESASYLKQLDKIPNIKLRTHFYPHRKSSIIALLLNRLWNRTAQMLFQAFELLLPAAFSTNVIGLEQILNEVQADIYLAHNIDTLLPCAQVAKRLGALLMFDSMEFHADMGDSQTKLEQKMIRTLESKWLSNCKLVLASSEQMADEIAKEYGIRRPLPLYNVPSIEPSLPPKNTKQFTLYWRNSVIGLSQRGLDEALLALSQLPEDITLHLQGRLPLDGGKALKTRIAKLNITQRVIIHPPYLPEEAIKMAATYTIGLCLERKGVRNHDLTVSNKMFDYMMAGLSVIASDLPGLRHIIERSNGGLLFEAGSADDLAKQIMTLYNNRSYLQELSTNARNFALSEGNWRVEMEKLTQAFSVICDQKYILPISQSVAEIAS